MKFIFVRMKRAWQDATKRDESQISVANIASRVPCGVVRSSKIKTLIQKIYRNLIERYTDEMDK